MAYQNKQSDDNTLKNELTGGNVSIADINVGTAGDAESGQAAGDAESGQAAGDAESGQAAGDAESGQAADDAESGKPAGDAESGHVADDAESGQAAGDTELSQASDDAKTGPAAGAAVTSEFGSAAGDSSRNNFRPTVVKYDPSVEPPHQVILDGPGVRYCREPYAAVADATRPRAVPVQSMPGRDNPAMMERLLGPRPIVMTRQARRQETSRQAERRHARNEDNANPVERSSSLHTYCDDSAAFISLCVLFVTILSFIIYIWHSLLTQNPETTSETKDHPRKPGSLD